MLSSAERTANKFSPMEGLVEKVHQTINCLTAEWDFAIDGGAVGTIALRNDLGGLAILPDKAIVFLTIIDNVTLPVSTGNNGTIAVGSEAAGDILATVDPDATNWTQSLPLVGANIPLIASKTTIKKMTAARQLNMVIATNAFTAGKIRFHVLYVLGA
jgi:hypothetical protein